MRTVTQIDQDIDAIRDDLKSRYPALRRVPRKHYGPNYSAACGRWQAAWDKHPDLLEQERQLFLERHAAREAEYAVEAAQARRTEAAKRRAAKRVKPQSDRDPRNVTYLELLDRAVSWQAVAQNALSLLSVLEGQGTKITKELADLRAASHAIQRLVG